MQYECFYINKPKRYRQEENIFDKHNIEYTWNNYTYCKLQSLHIANFSLSYIAFMILSTFSNLTLLQEF